jgi:hypothetical protein
MTSEASDEPPAAMAADGHVTFDPVSRSVFVKPAKHAGYAGLLWRRGHQAMMEDAGRYGAPAVWAHFTGCREIARCVPERDGWCRFQSRHNDPVTGNCPKWDTWPRLSPSTAKLRESPENSGLSAQHKQPPYGDRSDWSRAGITAGSGCASPATHVGYELIGAGMMILAGGGKGVPLDNPELELWTRVGFDRGMRSRKGER